MRAFGLSGSKDEIRLQLRWELRGLDERARRRKAAERVRVQEEETGHRDVSLYWELTDMARSTIARALKEEFVQNPLEQTKRIRRPGAGRKRRYEWDPAVMRDLKRLVERTRRGEAPRILHWTPKGLRELSSALNEKGHSTCPHLVADWLRELGYTLQGHGRTRGVGRNLDRDAQFQYINDLALSFLTAGDPVIAVETKTEVVPGKFGSNDRKKGGGSILDSAEFRPKVDPRLEIAFPSAVDAILGNKGWITAGMEGDTSSLSVHAVRRWWARMGHERHAQATRVMIVPDVAVRDDHLLRRWQQELQKLADELCLNLTVCHMPPGTRKWTNVEQRLFSLTELIILNRDLEKKKKQISRIFRTTVELIASPGATSEAVVIAELDRNRYDGSEQITLAERCGSPTQPHSFNGRWNYDISHVSSCAIAEI